MKNELLKIIKSFSGNVFTLGITDKDIIDSIQSNSNIDHFLMLNINKKIEYDESINYKPVKNVKIKKIKKKNKRKTFFYNRKIQKRSRQKDYRKCFGTE